MDVMEPCELRSILITGVFGFLGSNLLFHLRDVCPSLRIVGIDNMSYTDIPDDFYRSVTDNLDELMKADVSDIDIITLKNKLEKQKITTIFHFGAPSSIIIFKREPSRAINETIIGVRNMLKLAQEIGARLVFPSSGSVYGAILPPQKEENCVQPRNLYGMTKLFTEHLAYSEGSNWIALRIFAGYGPGEERKKDFGSVVYLFLRDAMRGDPIIIYGDGSQARDFIYVDDVVNAIINAALVDYVGTVNVGTGRSTTFNQIVEEIRRLDERFEDLTVKYVPRPGDYVDKLQADTTLMSRVLHIRKITPFKEGLRRFFLYLQNKESEVR